MSEAEDAFRQAVFDNEAVLFRLAVSLTDPNDAHDLVQDALTRAWAKWGTFDPGRGSPRAWLLAVLADQARARWRRVRITVATAKLPEDAEIEAPLDLRVDLSRAIAALPSRQRSVIVLRYYVDLRIDEIAKLMGCASGTVKSTLHDAHRKLSAGLGASYARH